MQSRVSLRIGEQVPAKFLEKLDSARKHSRLMHIDVMDGTIGEMKTFQPAQTQLIPGLAYTMHWLVTVPQKYFHLMQPCVVNMIHTEYVTDAFLERIPPEMSLGLALLPKSDIDRLEERIDYATAFLIMRDMPGKEGESQFNAILQKILRLRGYAPSSHIEFEGAMSYTEMVMAMRAGANTVSVNLDVLCKEVPNGALQIMQAIVKNNVQRPEHAFLR